MHVHHFLQNRQSLGVKYIVLRLCLEYINELIKLLSCKMLEIVK